MAESAAGDAPERALEALLRANQGGGADGEALRAAWAEAMAVKNATPQSAFAVFSLLQRHGKVALLRAGSLTPWLEPFLEAPTERRWGGLCRIVREPGDAAPSIRAFLKEEKAAAGRRAAATVTLAEFLPALRWVLPTLLASPQLRSTEIRPTSLRDGLEVFTGYTDGRDIYLCPAVSLFERAAHNELAYIRLLVHEALHLVRGSFDIERLRQCLSETAAALGTHTPRITPASTRGLSDLCELFEGRSALFFGLLNLVEDARIERHFDALAPGLSGVARAVDSAALELSSPTAFADLGGQFLRILAARLEGRASASLPTRIRARFAEVEPAVAAFRAAAAGASLVDSARLATKLTLWMSEHLGKEVCEALSEQLRLRKPVTASDVTVHVKLSPPGFRERSTLRQRMNLSRFSAPLAEAGVHVEEYDFWSDTVREAGASVVERPWDPYRAGAQGRTARAGVVEAEKRRAPIASLAATGRALDVPRFVRFLAERRGGRPADGRVFRRPTPTSTSPAVTVLLDLSASMVHFRPDGVRPIERAVGVVEEIVEQVGSGVRILGAVDPGPHEVVLHRIKAHDEPLRRTLLDSLHAYALGGFRVGPILRALARSSAAAERSPVWILTDCGNHYVTRGMHKFISLDRKLCADCPRLASYCQIEKPFPDEGWIGERASIFEPLEYEIADIRHALDATRARLDVHAVMLGDEWSDDVCDHTWGAGQWTRG